MCTAEMKKTKKGIKKRSYCEKNECGGKKQRRRGEANALFEFFLFVLTQIDKIKCDLENTLFDSNYTFIK